MLVAPAGGDRIIDIANTCTNCGHCIIDIVGVFGRVSCPRHRLTDRPRQRQAETDH